MKNVLISCCLLLTFYCSNAQMLKFEPEKPEPGQTIKVSYDATGGPIEASKNFEAVAYLLEDDGLKAVELDLQANGNQYTATLEANATTKVVFINFEDPEKNLKDNNDKRGYGTILYKSGKPVPGAYANMANAYAKYDYTLDLERDLEDAIEFMQKEFDLYPESKKNHTYQEAYALLGRRTVDDKVTADVRSMIDAALQEKKSEEAWMHAYTLSSMIKENDLKEQAEAQLMKKYPKGKIKIAHLMDQFYEEKDLEKRIALFEDYKKATKEEASYANTIENMAWYLAFLHGREGALDKMAPYEAMVEDKERLASLYNRIAWPMTGESIEAEAKNIDVAKRLSEKSISILNDLMEHPEKVVGEGRTNKQKVRGLKSSLAMYADTYALILYKTEDYKGALKYQQIAGDRDKFSDPDMNYRYVSYYEKVNGAEEAEVLLEDMIKRGVANKKMIEKHKTLFLANNTLESAYEKYYAGLDKEAAEVRKKKLKEQMLQEKAPEFSLVNLEGETVSSKDLIGKIVIVDFWATWCGPCIASFPGMQLAVNKYKDDKDVAFVFIDTWENVKDKKKNAADFIAKNDYSFNVLLDEKDKVVAAFKVNGIPTKFIIDQNGDIRFRAIGFKGSDEAVVNEISEMIEILEAEGQPGAD